MLTLDEREASEHAAVRSAWRAGFWLLSFLVVLVSVITLRLVIP